MNYAEKFLRAHGQECTILRTPTVTSYVSMKRSTRATRDLATREAYWEGTILADSNLSSGDIFQVGSDKYLVHSGGPDPASHKRFWFAAKTNATLTHKRLTKTANNNTGDITESWGTLTDNVPAFGQEITRQMRQYDPGLVDEAIYLFQVQSTLGVERLDRLVVNGQNLQVESVDDIGLSGVGRVQCSADLRP